MLSYSNVDDDDDEKGGKNRKNFSSGKKRKHPGQDNDEIISYILKSIKKQMGISKIYNRRMNVLYMGNL